tara:strand:- start:1282 stop:1416 length:135 start_codon:yes stop_codon:yes gene_type:complete
MAMNKIIPNVFIGDLKSALDYDGLKAEGITHIVQVMNGVKPSFP